MKNVSPYAKAAASFVAAAVVAYISATDGGVTGQEWLQIVLAGLGAAGVVYAVPNKPKTSERGAVDVVTALLVVFLVLVIVWFVAGHR